MKSVMFLSSQLKKKKERSIQESQLPGRLAQLSRLPPAVPSDPRCPGPCVGAGSRVVRLGGDPPKENLAWKRPFTWVVKSNVHKLRGFFKVEKCHRHHTHPEKSHYALVRNAQKPPDGTLIFLPLFGLCIQQLVVDRRCPYRSGVARGVLGPFLGTPHSVSYGECRGTHKDSPPRPGCAGSGGSSARTCVVMFLRNCNRTRSWAHRARPLVTSW